jgi:hypothetical protein
VLEPQPLEFEVSRSGNAHVRWIQRSLNRVAQAGLVEDGRMGARTRAALARFQRQQGLPPDGAAGSRTEAALIRAGAERPLQGAQSTAGRCRLDSRVAEVTILQPIPLGVAGVPNETAIYLPPGLRRSAQVDLLVYLHGWETDRNGRVICGRARNIAEYLADKQFALREVVRDSGKNAILVVPKLGTHSEPGTLANPGGFARFIEAVLGTLASCRAWTAAPVLRRLILAGHSGGGATVGRIAAERGELVAYLKEVWMLDALYGKVVPSWATFLDGRPDVVGRFLFTTQGGTVSNHKTLAERLRSSRATKVEIRLSRTPSHCQVPIAEFAGLLAQSSFDNR